MLLRKAVSLVRSAQYSAEYKVSLICSFEPLHFKTYLQAFLAQRFPEDTPEVLSFGFDQLAVGLGQTSDLLWVHPALLFLSWEDIHPQLTWRTRGSLGIRSPKEVVECGDLLRQRIETWLKARKGAESYVVLPPYAWLPLTDSVSPAAFGLTSAHAMLALAKIASAVAKFGGRILNHSAGALNFRDLLAAGCPLTLEDSRMTAQKFVEVAFPLLERKKALIVDLDGTLWYGSIGEDGLEGIHYWSDGQGYPFFVFQKFLVNLKAEGIVLGFCSKNNADDVIPIFDSLEMPVSFNDFAAYRCNWELKSLNLQAIAGELNIGLDALVYVDDNPAELAEIASALPEIRLFQTPQSGEEWLELFSNLRELFHTWQISEEDRHRTQSLIQEKARSKALDSIPKSDLTSSLSHLRGLALELIINPQAFLDARSLELINKTNQFNLSGERLSSADWLKWQQIPGVFCVSARLNDRFGDFGTIMVITGKVLADHSADIRKMVLSCRAFGRGVEQALLYQICRLYDLQSLTGRFVDTGKNEPALRFLNGLKCQWSTADRWTLTRKVVESAGVSALDESGMKVRICEASVWGKGNG